METLTLTAPTELVETAISAIQFVLFIITTTLQGMIALATVCFLCWAVFLSVTVPYMTIKSIFTKNK